MRSVGKIGLVTLIVLAGQGIVEGCGFDLTVLLPLIGG